MPIHTSEAASFRQNRRGARPSFHGTQTTGANLPQSIQPVECEPNRQGGQHDRHGEFEEGLDLRVHGWIPGERLAVTVLR